MNDDINNQTNKELSELELQIQQLNEQLQAEKNKYVRALADYQNLQRQTDLWKTELISFANEKLVKKFLELADDFERASGTIKNEGLDLIVKKFYKILTDEGVEQLDLAGTAYDPAKAEVVGVENGDNDNVIVKQLQRGFSLNGKIIRPAQVIVSKKDNNSKE